MTPQAAQLEELENKLADEQKQHKADLDRLDQERKLHEADLVALAAEKKQVRADAENSLSFKAL